MLSFLRFALLCFPSKDDDQKVGNDEAMIFAIFSFFLSIDRSIPFERVLHAQRKDLSISFKELNYASESCHDDVSSCWYSMAIWIGT